MLEKLTKALGEELSKEVETKLKEAGLEVGVTNDGSLVDAEKHDNMKAELKAANEQLKDTNSKIEELSKNSTVTEELKAQLEEANNKYEEYVKNADSRVRDLQIKTALEKGLIARNANQEALDLIIPTINTENIQIDKAGNIVDADDVFNPIVEARKTLFGKPVEQGAEPQKGTNPPTDTSQMTDTEYFKMKMQN